MASAKYRPSSANTAADTSRVDVETRGEQMTVISEYKRTCDKKIGGCGKTIDVNNMVTVVRGELHLCTRCAGKKIAKSLKRR